MSSNIEIAVHSKTEPTQYCNYWYNIYYNLRVQKSNLYLYIYCYLKLQGDWKLGDEEKNSSTKCIKLILICEELLLGANKYIFFQLHGTNFEEIY